MFGLFSLEKLNAKPSNIDGFIFIGAKETAVNDKALNKLGITHILNVSDEKQTVSKNYTYKQLPFVDSRNSNISSIMSDAFAFIDQAKHVKGKILIHCKYGQSRSVAIGVAWKLREAHQHGKIASYQETFKLFVTKRPLAAPNDAFVQQLDDYAKVLNTDLKSTLANKTAAAPSN